MKRHFFWRSNTTPIYDPTGQRFRAMPKYSMRGVPDIILVKNGQFWGLEVKRQGTKQSTAQLDFERNLTNSGGKYAVVRSLDDVIALGL